MNRRNFLKAIGLATASTTLIKADILSEPDTIIQPKLPTLAESSNSINRIGLTKVEMEDQIADYGSYIPYEKHKFSQEFLLPILDYRNIT